MPTILEKLAVLADAAKHDVSCSSSGSRRAPARDGQGLGSLTGMGVCHSFTPDGRCVSLLKILLTNVCIYDCLYCGNRRSSNVPRARFTVDEVVGLTMDFYRRNYVSGLFLSSGVVKTPDHTMEDLIRVARILRQDRGFRGYIHLKTIPGADADLIRQAGLYADRLSVNVELPDAGSLTRLAPQKDETVIRRSMGVVNNHVLESREDRKAPRFSPAGHTTQMIVGADATPDRGIIASSAALYRGFGVKRVYYSAFSPQPGSGLPDVPPPLIREHRLYQADWLVRFYDFAPEEMVTGADGMLDLAMDPKLSWALAHRGRFPVDVNRADREMLLRVPGLGVRTVDRLLGLRRQRMLRLDDLAALRVPLAKVMPFISVPGHQARGLDDAGLRRRFAPKPQQLSLF